MILTDFIEFYHCPSCFYNWKEEIQEKSPHAYRQDKICSVCEKGLTSKQLMKRQLEIMSSTYVSDLPKIVKHLAEFINLEDE